VYNCSILASGPIRQLQTLRRLLGAGVRPDLLFVEAWAPYLVQRGDWWEEQVIQRHDLRPGDWDTLAYCPGLRTQLRRQLLEDLLVPGYAFRQSLLKHWRLHLLPYAEEGPLNAWCDPSRRHPEDGWLDPPGEPHPLKPGTGDYLFWQASHRAVCDPFTPHPPAEQALRDLLRLAAERGIRTCLLLCPEPSAVRGPAGMETWEANRAYLEGLSREFAVPVADTRDWVADDGFTDFSHVVTSSARPYTERFGREVLQPLLAGRALQPNVLLNPSSYSPPRRGPAQ
jgi:hypothetical protein